MDKTEYLEKYKKKIEYLNFDEEITKLFNESYEISCNNRSEDFNVQLEYEFILRLIKLAKNQNHDIYEALSIYFEKYNEFYLRNRKKDIVNISHEKQKENYDEAFDFTVKNYEEGQLFYKELVQNINLAYKNQLHKKGALDMKYDITIKSIYELFSKYDKSIVEMVLGVLKKTEPISFSILTKKYGENFDGMNSEKVSYMEQSRIDNILVRLEQQIELAEYEVSMGKALKKVRIFLEKANDTKIIEAINKMKESKSKYLVIKDIEELKNKFHVNDAILKIAIGFEKDTIEKKVFCLTYGFECKRKSLDKICEILNISYDNYKNYLNVMLKKMPELINQAKDYYELLGKRVNNNRKNNSKLKHSFFEYFYDDNMTDKEKEEVKAFVIKYLDNTKGSQAYELVVRRYGENYDTLNENITFNKEERTLYENFKVAIKNKIKTGNMAIRVKKVSFFEWFYEDNMSDKEKEETRIFVRQYLDNNKGCHEYELVVRKYGENYDTLNENITFNRQESILYENFKASIKRKIKTGNMDLSKKISFFDLFYKENMSDKEKEEIKIFVSKYLDVNKEKQAYELVVRKYGENYDTLNKNITFTEQESTLYENFKTSIRRKIKTGNIDLSKKISFFDLFYKDNMSDKEKEEIKIFVSKYLDNNKECQAYELVVRKYGKNYDALNENITFNRQESILYKNFKASIRRKIKTGNMTIRTTFFDWFYEEGMSDKEKEEVKIFVSKYLDKNKESQAHELVVRKYGENYDTLNKNVTFTKQERTLYENFKTSIKNKIKTGNMTTQIKKVSFFEYFYEDNLSDKEKEEVKIFVSEFLDKNKESQAYKLVVRKYGENYDTLNRNMIFTKQESTLYENFKSSIRRKLKNKNNLKLNSSKIKHSYNEKLKEEKEAVESQEVKIIPSALNYTDTIIYKLTELKYSLGKISLLLNVDTDFILKSYISNLDYYSLSFVINTIMEYNPRYLINILSSNYFDELLNILSPIEKQLIYYLILAKNNMISLDEISTIMNISVKDITNYQIYTREEKYNELNNYISFNNEKKKVLTSKM